MCFYFFVECQIKSFLSVFQCIQCFYFVPNSAPYLTVTTIRNRHLFPTRHVRQNSINFGFNEPGETLTECSVFPAHFLDSDSSIKWNSKQINPCVLVTGKAQQKKRYMPKLLKHSGAAWKGSFAAFCCLNCDTIREGVEIPSINSLFFMFSFVINTPLLHFVNIIN